MEYEYNWKNYSELLENIENKNKEEYKDKLLNKVSENLNNILPDDKIKVKKNAVKSLWDTTITNSIYGGFDSKYYKPYNVNHVLMNYEEWNAKNFNKLVEFDNDTKFEMYEEYKMFYLKYEEEYKKEYIDPCMPTQEIISFNDEIRKMKEL